MLQGHRRKGDEAIGCRGAELRQLFVLDLDQFGRRVALGAIPIGVDAERLDRGRSGAFFNTIVRYLTQKTMAFATFSAFLNPQWPEAIAFCCRATRRFRREQPKWCDRLYGQL